jgi:hypothetical protein
MYQVRECGRFKRHDSHAQFHENPPNISNIIPGRIDETDLKKSRQFNKVTG